MKAKHVLFVAILTQWLMVSCFKDKLEIGGDQSTMGEVGATYSVGESNASALGVTNAEGVVNSLGGGVSNMTFTAVVTNPVVRNVIGNLPDATVNGNNVSLNIKFKSTKDGISVQSPLVEGIIADYGAKVGDTYPMGNTKKKREVVSRSSDDDYSYGFMLVKVIKVVEPTESFGIKETTYWVNHKYGLVGISFLLDDGTEARFYVYCSADNW